MEVVIELTKKVESDCIKYFILTSSIIIYVISRKEDIINLIR